MCEIAAARLDMQDTSANNLDSGRKVAGCYVSGRGKLRFNTNLGSSAVHKTNNPRKVVLCRRCSVSTTTTTTTTTTTSTTTTSTTTTADLLSTVEPFASTLLLNHSFDVRDATGWSYFGSAGDGSSLSIVRDSIYLRDTGEAVYSLSGVDLSPYTRIRIEASLSAWSLEAGNDACRLSASTDSFATQVVAVRVKHGQDDRALVSGFGRLTGGWDADATLMLNFEADVDSNRDLCYLREVRVIGYVDATTTETTL